jgi:hypothetical protein
MKKKTLAVAIGILVMLTMCWASTKMNDLIIQNSAMNTSTINSTSVGATTPSTGNFTSLAAQNFTASTSIRGSFYSGNRCVHTDGSGNIVENSTGVGCSGQWQVTSGSGCSTGGVAWNTCPNTFSWPIAFPDTTYYVACQGLGATGGFPAKIFINSVQRNTGSVVVTTSDAGSDIDNFSNITCIAYHP